MIYQMDINPWGKFATDLDVKRNTTTFDDEVDAELKQQYGLTFYRTVVISDEDVLYEYHVGDPRLLTIFLLKYT